MAAAAAWISVVLDTIQNILVVGEIGLLIWLFQGGWMWGVRKIDFFIDCKIVNFIADAYKYFNMFLNPNGLAENNLFNPYITGQIVNNIYVFIGVIVFFRLMMVLIKYLLNPDLVTDAKIGVNSLIQRCIIGMCGILFIPTLFDLAMELQVAILKDQIIQQIIVPKDVLDMIKDEMAEGGKYVGTYVLSGFVSPKTSASKSTKNEYNLALSKGDLSSIDINEGGWMAQSDSYEYEYFFLISTLVLCYVFFQIIKYTIDLAVRAFKMLLYQILAPIAMIEYMISGADDGVFKSWRTAVIGTYAMIFTRVMAIWFVIFITVLMSGKPEIVNYTSNSLLGKTAIGSENPDFLLRAIIIIALLGFMIDLPKLIGQVFGIDLEQQSSATGVLKQVGGIIKGAAIGGIAATGATIGSAAGGLGKIASTGRQAKIQAKANGARGLSVGRAAAKDIAKKRRETPGMLGIKAAGIGAGIGGAVSAALGSNQITGAFANSYSSNKQKQMQSENNREQIGKKMDAAKEQKAKEDERENLATIAANSSGVQKVEIDQKSIAALSGMSAASANANNSLNNNQQAGKTTVEVSDIDVKVTGKSVANYDGGLETNISGKATTTYNGDLETIANGNAIAKYDNDLNVEVAGNANATLNKDINVEVNGNTTAIYDGNFDTMVTGNATTIVEGGSETLVEGETKVELEEIEVKQKKSNKNSDNLK